ncbi:MAG: fibronectin type III domain-containing protein [Muribaculum sp.]|nr:fibronectin type III domain-containing protein [Muribaculum sp.]
MKKIIYFALMSTAMISTMTSCWEDEVISAGDARPQVEQLKAVPGDEEVLLTWEAAEGYNPSDFIIKYKEDDEIEIRTGNVRQYNVSSLTNGKQYKFSVQAVYGKLISGAVSVAGQPSTTRFPVTDLVAEAGDQYVILSWSTPSTSVQGYTLSYAQTDNAGNPTEVKIGATETSYAVNGLENDINYTFTLTADYARGASEPATIKAMPTTAIPYFLSRTSAAVGQTISFSFNTEGYPTATEVKWTFPGNESRMGTDVDYKFSSVGTQTVKLSANINGVERTWSLEVNIREYVVYSDSWEMNGTNYEGFKGTCPVFSPDGKTIYIITFNKVAALYAFDLETGAEKWHYTPSALSGTYNMLTVNPITGDIYYGTTTAGQFYAVSNEGELLWNFGEAQSMNQSTAPAVSADGTTVFLVDASGNLFAVDAASGAKKWSYAGGSAGCGLIVNGQELVAGFQKKVAFLNVADGSEVASVALSKNMVKNSGFAVAADKTTAYIPQAGGFLSSIDINAHKIIVNAFAVATGDIYEPAVAPNGNVYVGSKNSHVYCVSGDLTQVIWDYTHISANNAFNFSHPCVDTESRLYISSGQVVNSNFIFDPSGNVIEKWSYGDDANQKQMGGNNYLDGVLYSAFIGSASGNGIFVGKYVGGERASGWSTHGGDICGSCCLK